MCQRWAGQPLGQKRGTPERWKNCFQKSLNEDYFGEEIRQPEWLGPFYTIRSREVTEARVTDHPRYRNGYSVLGEERIIPPRWYLSTLEFMAVGDDTASNPCRPYDSDRGTMKQVAPDWYRYPVPDGESAEQRPNIWKMIRRPRRSAPLPDIKGYI